MEDVANPIIIDQFYCDSPKACENQVPSKILSTIAPKFCVQIIVTFELFLIFLICQTSAVNISKIVYKNISGTTTSEKAMKFACSDAVPCSNIVLSNVNLEKKDGTVETYCNSAQGFGYGTIHPSADCLSSHDKNHLVINQSDDPNLAEPGRQDIVHTEF